MKREIKFRVFDQFRRQMVTVGVDSNASFNHDGTISTHGVLGENPIMQYTGLKDKNGVEIYEGDILILHPENHFPIVLDGKLTNDLSQIKSIVEFGLNCLNKNSNLTVLGFALKSVDGSGYSVFNGAENLLIIGNIYQNPELLPNSR